MQFRLYGGRTKRRRQVICLHNGLLRVFPRLCLLKFRLLGALPFEKLALLPRDPAFLRSFPFRLLGELGHRRAHSRIRELRPSLHLLPTARRLLPQVNIHVNARGARLPLNEGLPRQPPQQAGLACAPRTDQQQLRAQERLLAVLQQLLVEDLLVELLDRGGDERLCRLCCLCASNFRMSGLH